MRVDVASCGAIQVHGIAEVVWKEGSEALGDVYHPYNMWHRGQPHSTAQLSTAANVNVQCWFKIYLN